MSADKDSMKIPLWFGNSKDTFSAEHWIKRLETSRATNGWSEVQTVGHAHAALREKALLFRDYLENEKLGSDSWDTFKERFLEHFGSQVRDTSKITNLSLTQNSGERANYFGWRVSSAVQDFFTSVPVSRINTADPKFDSVPQGISQKFDTDEIAHHRSYLVALVSAFHEDWMQSVSSSLGRVIFLNGLSSNIQMITKLKHSTSLDHAVQAAMKAEKAAMGPSNRQVDKSLNQVAERSEEEDEDRDPEVSYVQKRRYPRARTNQGQSGGTFRKKGSVECWYCHKRNHMQLNCKLRLSRGAAMVNKPRTVQDIQHDRMAYQIEESEESDSDDTKSEKDNLEVTSLSRNHLN